MKNMKTGALATVVDKTTESDVIFVKCDDGHVYAREATDFLNDIQINDWIKTCDWELVK